MITCPSSRSYGLRCSPRPARARTAVVFVRAQRRPASQHADGAPAPQLLQALETAAVVLAVGTHLAAAVAQRQYLAAAQQAAQQAAAAQHTGSRRVAQAAAAQPMQPPPPQPVGAWASPGSLWLSLPLVAAVALGRLRAWLTPSSSPASPGVEAAARLLRAEAAAGQQAQRIDDLARQVDKLSTRSRLVGRDLKLPIQQLQSAAGQQSEALVNVAQRMEHLEKEIKETEELVEAMQGVSAKQFALLVKVLQQQQQQQQQQAAEASQLGPAGPPPAGLGTPVRAQPAAVPPRTASSAGGSKPAAAAPPPPAPKRQQRQPKSGTSGAGVTDEWGRAVVQMPSPVVPPVPNGSPASLLSSGVLRPLGSAADAAAAAVATAAAAGDAAADAAAAAAATAAAADAAAAAAAAVAAAAAGGGDEVPSAPPAAAEVPTEQQQTAAAAAEGSAQGGEQQQKKPQQQKLSLDSFLGIIKEDAYFKAEQEMIRAVVNQSQAPAKPEVEILPPLYPPPPEPASPEEAALANKRREQVEEWRQRMRRSWDASQLEAALASASHDEDGGVASAPPGGEQTEQTEQPAPSGPADVVQEGVSAPPAVGGEEGAGEDAPPPPGAGRDGVQIDEGDDGTTTFHFK